MTPLQQAAYDIGAKGSEPTEEDRLSFEAWMRGHCWKVEGDWNGRQYVHAHESTGFAHGGAMNTRRLWAAWRDRGALAAQQVAMPAGHVLVPFDPTIAMMEAGSIATDYDYSQERVRKVWQQMAYAAPQGDTK